MTCDTCRDLRPSAAWATGASSSSAIVQAVTEFVFFLRPMGQGELRKKPALLVYPHKVYWGYGFTQIL